MCSCGVLLVYAFGFIVECSLFASAWWINGQRLPVASNLNLWGHVVHMPRTAKELFLWYGADPDHKDQAGHSALDYARLRQPQASAALEALLRGSLVEVTCFDLNLDHMV